MGWSVKLKTSEIGSILSEIIMVIYVTPEQIHSSLSRASALKIVPVQSNWNRCWLVNFFNLVTLKWTMIIDLESFLCSSNYECSLYLQRECLKRYQRSWMDWRNRYRRMADPVNHLKSHAWMLNVPNSTSVPILPKTSQMCPTSVKRCKLAMS